MKSIIKLAAVVMLAAMLPVACMAASSTQDADNPVDKVWTQADLPTTEIDSAGVIVLVLDIEQAIKAAGGAWIDAEQLPYSNTSDFEYAGFIIRRIPGLLVYRRDVLNKLVSEVTEIFDPEFDSISKEELDSMKMTDMSAMGIFDGKMRLITKNYIATRRNPSMPFCELVEAMGNYRAKMK